MHTTFSKIVTRKYRINEALLIPKSGMRERVDIKQAPDPLMGPKRTQEGPWDGYLPFAICPIPDR